MPESKKSGELILKNLQTFNEAYSFFILSINTKIEQGMDKCIEYFANKNHWEGKFQFSEGKDWLRPNGWKTNYGPEAKFSIKCAESEEDDNLWLSCFCQNSINNAEAGFFFEKKFSEGKKKE